jgi:hypothetical protein
MIINTVSVSIRYSKPMGDGSFKTVEIGAEATLNPDEDFHDAQVTLYHELGGTMKYVFSGNGSGKAQPGPEKAVAAPPPSALPQREHWCEEHRVEYKRHEKSGQVWFSHKVGDGWCKE